MNDLCGVINIYKEKGFTSHDVVNIVRKTLNRVKTGHTGTLDPEACGVLPVCVGKATKIADYIASEIKEYIAELTLGVSTTTQDHMGEILDVCEVNAKKSEIEEAVMSFKGEYVQEPPMYSAIKINGKKLYELAREGKEVERKKRTVYIYDIKIIGFSDNNKKVKMTVLCSKGTYIRTLCSDIGEKLGCKGHMSSLLRTRTGNFYLENSIKLNDFKELVLKNEIEKVLIPIDNILCEYKKITIPERANKLLYNGNPLQKKFIGAENLIDGEKLLVYDFEKKLIGIYESGAEFIKPLTMLI